MGVGVHLSPTSAESGTAWLAEVAIFGLVALGFLLSPDVVTDIVGPTLARILSLAFAGLWFVYAFKLVVTGRLSR